MATRTIDRETLDRLIEKAARAYNLPHDLLRAVIQVESGGDPQAVSPAGARGLMQLMPETARLLGVRDPFDPEQNVMGGAQFLRYLLDRFGGDLDKALAAYNAGPAAVERFGGIPPYRETQEYVRRVRQAMRAEHQPGLLERAGEALLGPLIPRSATVTENTDLDKLEQEVWREVFGESAPPAREQTRQAGQAQEASAGQKGTREEGLRFLTEADIQALAARHGGVYSRTTPARDEIREILTGQEPPQKIIFNDGTSLIVQPRAAGAKEYHVVGGDVFRYERALTTRQVTGATPRERHIVLLTPEGEIRAVPNPNYDEALVEAERARARHQAELDRIRADLEARRISLEEARQRAEESYRRFQQDLERARLQAALRQQDIDLARGILGESAGLLRESLRYLAPPGTSEDLARLIDAFRTGQLPEIRPRTMKPPFNFQTIGLDLARQVLQAVERDRSPLPALPQPVLTGREAAPSPALPPVGGRLSPEPPAHPWPRGEPQDIWGPALRSPRPGAMEPREGPPQDLWGPALQAPRPGTMVPREETVPLLGWPPGIFGGSGFFREGPVVGGGSGFFRGGPVIGGGSGFFRGGEGEPSLSAEALTQALGEGAASPMEWGLTPPPLGPRPESMIPGVVGPLLPPVPLSQARRLWEAFAAWLDAMARTRRP